MPAKLNRAEGGSATGKAGRGHRRQCSTKNHLVESERGGMLHRRLVGMPDELSGLCKLRVGDCRILYWIYHEKKLVRLYRAQHRSEVYRDI